MSKQAVFTMKLEHELRDEFMAEAEATHRSASQLVREFMRDFIQHQHQAREHDDWFKHQVQISIDDTSQTMSHDQVMSEMKSKLAARISKAHKL
jgi:predicted transcriptional regulator